MNRARRKRIMQLNDQLDAIRRELEEIMDEEDGVRENMIEYSPGYEASEEAASNLQDAIGALDEAQEYLEAIME